MDEPIKGELMLAMKESDLRVIYESIQTGIEYARMSLIEHDSSLGRTTLKNRSWAETMETDIEKMRGTLDILVDRFHDRS